MYIVLDSTNRVVATGSTPISMDNCETFEIPDNQEIMNNPSVFILKGNEIVKDEVYLLEILKKEKGQELNNACSNAIMSGFNHIIDGVEYHFFYDAEAQINLQDMFNMLNTGLKNDAKITVMKNGENIRLEITKGTLSGLMVASFEHKERHLSKYRDELVPLIEQATTLEEIQSITWSTGSNS